MTVQLYVGRLGNNVRRNEMMDHFSRFGHVDDVRVCGEYGFIYVTDNSTADKILGEQHTINGMRVLVEEARGSRDDRRIERRPRYDSRDRHPRDRERYDSRDRYYRDRERYDSRDRYYRERDRSPGGRWDSGDYYRDREYPRDARRKRLERRRNPRQHEFRVVVENLPKMAVWSDLKQLSNEKGFSPIFTKITAAGDMGFVDFATQDEMERAIEALDGQEIRSTKITARKFEHKLRRDRDPMDIQEMPAAQGDKMEEAGMNPHVNYDDVDQRAYSPN